MFTTESFIIGKRWQQCKCPSNNDWTKKMYICIYTTHVHIIYYTYILHIIYIIYMCSIYMCIHIYTYIHVYTYMCVYMYMCKMYICYTWVNFEDIMLNEINQS